NLRSFPLDWTTPDRGMQCAIELRKPRAGSIIEEMQILARNHRLDRATGRQRELGIDAGDTDVVAVEPHCEELLVAELLGDHQNALEPELVFVGRHSQPDVLRAH